MLMMVEEETQTEETTTESLENLTKNVALQEVMLWVLVFVIYLAQALQAGSVLSVATIILILAAVARLYIKVKYPQFQLA